MHTIELGPHSHSDVLQSRHPEITVMTVKPLEHGMERSWQRQWVARLSLQGYSQSLFPYSQSSRALSSHSWPCFLLLKKLLCGIFRGQPSSQRHIFQPHFKPASQSTPLHIVPGFPTRVTRRAPARHVWSFIAMCLTTLVLNPDFVTDSLRDIWTCFLAAPSLSFLTCQK